ncbi:AmmeMemoRadiSam system protein A [Pseudothermotoga thermarum]|uniref:AMMECR1 domain protein n=1 Tax=Pseudothermotoga thermarum DSM 5069 TaxID=688269 RepID=F7YY84_9THEM|nr:AmmeMemoRadiSam system protein A [Pseudothermotoga thermarum]AEH50905.1 AMMECR1 domain protein [Pseudothermotoga thermarum DSM 5069]
MKGNHEYVRWAIKCIESYIRDHKILDPIRDGAPADLLQRRAGAFVSLHKLDGSLRGCIGTYLPTRKNLAEEIMYNAIAAATEDPRFEPVREEELDEIEVSVDILSEPWQVTFEQYMNLDPKKYGVIVMSGFRRGLLLPDLPGVETPDQQLKIALRKAGISPYEKFSIYVFTVERYH